MTTLLWFILGFTLASIGWLSFILWYYAKAKARVRQTMIRNKLMGEALDRAYGPKAN